MSIINNFDTNYSKDLNNYELLTLTKQENISEELPMATVHGRLKNDSNSSEWTGEIWGKQDSARWDFKFGTTSSYPLRMTNNPQDWNSYTNICPYVNDNDNEKADFNNIMGRTTFNSFYFIKIYACGNSAKNTVTEVYFYWDLYQSCTPTFNYAFGANYCDFTPILYGSNDNNTWTPIATLTVSSSALKNYAIPTPYRYYKMVFTMVRNQTSGSYYTSCSVYNLFFTNVPDIKRKYKNHFISENNFINNQCKNIIIPNYDNGEYVVENVINNISCNEILKPNEYYQIRYNNNSLELNNNPVPYICGTYTGYTDGGGDLESQIINLGFTPSAVMVFHSYDHCFASRDGYAGQADSASNAIHSAGSSSGYITIVENGFKAINGTDSSSCFNYENTKYYYIAFR